MPSPVPPPGSRPESVKLVLAGAMLTSLSYLGSVGWKHFAGETFVAASRDVLWMAPISAALFALVLCAPAIAVAPYLARARAREVALFAASTVFVFANLLPWTSIHRVPALLLAAGVGCAAARSLASDRAVARIVRGAAAIAVAHAAAAAIAFAHDTRALRAAMAALPEAPAGAPNVLLLILDTVRASSMGLYGYERATTPEIDRFAKGGVTFDHAISTAPWTLPSHGSIFTGEYAGALSTTFRTRLGRGHPTLAEVLRSAGYETAGFTANLHYTAWDSGLQRGFIRYLDFPRRPGQLLRSGWFGQTGFVQRLLAIRERWQLRALLADPRLYVAPKPGGDDLDAEAMTDAVLAWQAAREARPFFAFVNYFDAHSDYRPPRHLRTRFASQPTHRDLYDAEIAHLDHHVGRLLRELERRGALANTLVVITSDHGEQFGEHGNTGHGNSLYYQLLHVPLVLRFDGRIGAGQRVKEPVSLRDLAATVHALVLPARPSPFPGVPLEPLWSGRPGAVRPSPVISEVTLDPLPPSGDLLRRSQMVAFTAGTYHYIRRNARETEELYDVGRDMAETRDLARSDSGRRIAAALRDSLRTVLEESARRGAR